MNIFKKYLAMFLAICMLLSVLPMTAWANETEGTEDSAGTEAPVDAQTSSDEEAPADSGTSDEVTISEDSQEETEAQDEESQEETEAQDEESQEETEAQDEENGEDIPVVLADTDPVPGHMATKPGDGKTTGEPFPKGTAGSNSFRIPALVTLSDGTLVAAADARWNTTYDGGGLDTIVARSSDNGANWDYTFANYLGDNGNTYNGSGSTAFIDPALAVTANDTIYMLVDLYPYGIALNGDGTQTAPKTDVGFNDAGKLLLSNDNHTSYGYYLDGNTIKAADGTVQTGYYVDAYFNLYTVDGDGNKTYASNLFFSDSAFKVVRTGYLYLTKSTDKGATWSEPTLLDLKTENEMVCLVGPGRGLVTGSGMIVFPTYSYHGDNAPTSNTQRLSFVYSTDGVNWSRTAELNHDWASEAAVVELKDGNLRFFFRNGTKNLCYVDYNVTGNTWGTPVTMTDIDTNSNCQISAVTYSKTIDGKQVILVSCPTGANSAGDNSSSASARLNGKIFAFTVETDGTMTKVGEKSVTSNNAQFMYSCLTELKDGTVGILYEDKENEWGVGDSSYYTMAYDTYDPEKDMGLTSGAETHDEGGDDVTVESIVDVTLKVGETSQTYTDDTGNYQDDKNNIDPNTQIATMNVTGTEGVTETVVSTTKTTTADELNDGATFIIRVLNTDYALTSNQGGTTWGDSDGAPRAFEVFNGAEADNMWTLEASGSGYKLKCAAGYLNLGKNAAWITESGGDTFTITYSNDGWAISDGTYNIDALGGGVTAYYCAGGWPNSGTRFDFYEVTAMTPATSTITFEGIAPGETYAVVGSTQYNITVRQDEWTVDIELEEGETFTYTDTTGVHTGDDDIKQRPDEAYATMDVQAAAIPVTSVESGKEYLIVNRNTGDILTDTVIAVPSNEVTWGDKTGLKTTGKLSNDSTELWTITKTDSGYTVVQDGKYLTVAGYYADMSETATNLTLTYTNNGWTILDSETAKNKNDATNFGTGSYYLSDNVGDGYSGGALGRSDTNNDYVYWDIYELSAATEVTFTGVASTTTPTTAKVGKTTYNITVVPKETDDEVENTATDIWTVDPEVQDQRINDATVTDGVYSDETWEAYEEALTAANDKLAEITVAAYTSPEAAQAALEELTALTDALEAAKNGLVPGKAITIRYWRLGEMVLEETIHVPTNAVSYELEPTKLHGGAEYTLSTTTLVLAGDVSEFDIQLLRENDATSGIIGHEDKNGTVIAGHAVNEMTVTVGIQYNLDVADILSEGQTIEWSSGDVNIATVDSDGMVTAVGAGTTTITASIRDANGNEVKSYTIPITVLPGAGDADKRTAAIYIDQVKNTSVACVIYANDDIYQFEVVEGELIYGEFKKGSSGTDVTTGIHFYGNPDDEHALAFMSSTNSAGDYFPVHKDGKVVEDALTNENALATTFSGYFANTATGPAGALAKGLSDNGTGDTIDPAVWKEKIVDIAQSYADLGYDGALGFTRRTNDGDLGSNLSFASEPLPKMDKVVDGVLPTGGKFDNYQRYVENMVAAVDEMVFFKITVTLERPTVWVMENGAIKKDDEGKQIGAITYSAANLIDTALEVADTLEMDAYFYTKDEDQADGVWDGQFENNRVNEKEITDALNEGWADNETVRVLDYYLVYKIQQKDIPLFNIKNTASLTFNYASAYSSGALSSTADAQADITVIGVAMDNVVIDFGQSFVYDGLTNRHLKGVYVDGENDDKTTTQCKAYARYGSVTVTREQMKNENGELLWEGDGDDRYPQYEYTVTYTPTSILQGPDMVLLYGAGENNQEKVINGFIVYPATTVYYEEGFAFPAVTNPGTHTEWDMTTEGNWILNNSRTATVFQTFERLGKTETNTIKSDKIHPYGFDPVYNGNDTLNGSYAETSTVGAKTRFVFTGDGIQIFAKCTDDPSGYVSVEVREATAPYKIVRLAMVNTKVLAGTTNATTGQTDDMDGLPVVSLINIEGMDYGQYIVTITKVLDNRPVYIDGFRVFNTVESKADSSPFTIDLEDQPEFYELRDAVLHALEVDADTSEDYDKLAEQIYNEINGASALITGEKVDYASDATAQDLLDNGPKNELFLYPGQTLTFIVSTDRTMQVGLKTPRGTTKALVTVNDVNVLDDTTTDEDDDGRLISSSVDMFYPLVTQPTGTETSYTVKITNNGSDILSVTLLKICDDPNAAFTQLTKEDIESILTGVAKPVTILSQPADTAVAMGERFNVEVIAQGEGLKYQWYFRNAGETVFHKSGVRDNTYDDVMTAARAGREVYCVITDAAGNSVTTDTARIDAIPNIKLEILQQPADQIVDLGARYNAEVIAQGEGLKYQWYFRNAGETMFHKSGVRDNTYDDVMTVARNGREVYCVITDAFGNTVTTDTVKLIANPGEVLKIVQQPGNAEAKLGENFMVEVIAQGEGLRYQWFYRNAGGKTFVKSGVRDNTYDDVMTTARNGREVYCVITDAFGNTVTTDTVKLVALPSQTLEILQQPGDAEAKLGENFMVEVIAQGDGLRYRWYFRNRGQSVWHLSSVRDNTYDDVMTTARAGREVYCVITDAFGNTVTTEIVRLICTEMDVQMVVQN